jgi:hypothetical protein
VRELLDERRVAGGGAECASACGRSGDASARRSGAAEHTAGSRGAICRSAIGRRALCRAGAVS